jgi:hypothetical protein
MKTCPYCAEHVRNAVIQCPACRSSLHPGALRSVAIAQNVDQEWVQRFAALGVACVILTILILELIVASRSVAP